MKAILGCLIIIGFLTNMVYELMHATGASAWLTVNVGWWSEAGRALREVGKFVGWVFRVGFWTLVLAGGCLIAYLVIERLSESARWNAPAPMWLVLWLLFALAARNGK